jgi:hypothetical protein
VVNAKTRTYPDFHNLWFARVAKNADVEQSELRCTKKGEHCSPQTPHMSWPRVSLASSLLELASVIEGTTTAKAEALEHPAQRKAKGGHVLAQGSPIEGERSLLAAAKDAAGQPCWAAERVFKAWCRFERLLQVIPKTKARWPL